VHIILGILPSHFLFLISVEIRNYVKDLLYLHDCVIIPGFGGFVTSYHPAEIHRFRNVVYPPSKTILFNRRLQNNDGVFINYMAQHEKISYAKAEETVRQHVVWWNRLLENKGVVSFPDVGKLYINSANVLVFLPELRKNYLPETFGLKPVAHYPQLEVVSFKGKKELPSEPMSEVEYAQKLHVRRKSRMQLTAAAVVTGALLFFMPQLFLQNYLPEKIRIEPLLLLNIFKSEKEIPIPGKSSQKESTEIISQDLPLKEEIQPVEKIEEPKAEMPVADSVSEASAEEREKADETAVDGNYYIILGSYDFISDAIRVKKQLDSQYGKTLEVFPSERGDYLIGVFAGSKENAQVSLSEFENGGLKPRIIHREPLL